MPDKFAVRITPTQDKVAVNRLVWNEDAGSYMNIPKSYRAFVRLNAPNAAERLLMLVQAWAERRIAREALILPDCGLVVWPAVRLR